MKLTSALLAAAFVVGTAGLSQAQMSDNHAAPGTVAPYAARVLPNGEVAPPPAARANGGVGGTEISDGKAQTRSGGPVGGAGVNH